MIIDLSKPIGVYREHQKKTSNEDTYTFYGAYVKAGTIVILGYLAVAQLSVIDETMRIGYQDGDEDIHWIKKQQGTDEHEEYTAEMTGKLILVENERPVGRVETPTDESELTFTASGLVYKVE